MDKNLEIYNSIPAVKEFSGQYLKPGEKKIFGKFLKERLNVLDLGCGTGRTTSFLKAYNVNVTGADYAPEMIKKARELHPGISFHVADAKNLPFRNGEFDVVIFSFNGLDYLCPKPERLKALGEISRVLKGGGLFIFSSHNSLRIPLGRKRLGGWFKNILSLRWRYRFDYQDFGSLLTYFGSSFSQKKDLKKAGFETVYSLGDRFSNPLLVNFLESHIYFVAEKR